MKEKGKMNSAPMNNVAEAIIYKRMCPANIFAKRRTDNEMGRNRKDNISITTNRGASHNGIPLGRNILKKSSP